MDMMSKQIMTHINLARHLTAGVGSVALGPKIHFICKTPASQSEMCGQDWNTMTIQ